MTSTWPTGSRLRGPGSTGSVKVLLMIDSATWLSIGPQVIRVIRHVMRPEGLSRRRRWLVVVIRCVSLFIAGLDSTIVNVALPSIQRDPHASVSELQWTVDTYTLVLASLLIVAGSTADRVGRRRIFQTSPVRFTVGSLLCSPAPALGWLVASGCRRRSWDDTVIRLRAHGRPSGLAHTVRDRTVGPSRRAGDRGG